MKRIPRKKKKEYKKDGVLWLMHKSKETILPLIRYTSKIRLIDLLTNNGK